MTDTATPKAFDWNISGIAEGDVRDPDGKVVPVQYVMVGCRCMGVWAAGVFVGWSQMCYAHEAFKLLARVAQSAN